MSFPRMRYPVNRSVLPIENEQFHTSSIPMTACHIIRRYNDRDQTISDAVEINALYQINWDMIDERLMAAALYAIQTGGTHVDVFIAIRRPISQTQPESTNQRQAKPMVRKITLRKITLRKDAK